MTADAAVGHSHPSKNSIVSRAWLRYTGGNSWDELGINEPLSREGATGSLVRRYEHGAGHKPRTLTWEFQKWLSLNAGNWTV
jgi:hypothetical protein